MSFIQKDLFLDSGKTKSIPESESNSFLYINPIDLLRGVLATSTLRGLPFIDMLFSNLYKSCFGYIIIINVRMIINLERRNDHGK